MVAARPDILCTSSIQTAEMANMTRTDTIFGISIREPDRK